MMDSSLSRDPVELLADEFAARRRRGETPSIPEYVAQYPQYAEQIEQLFPAVAMLEQLRVEATGPRHSDARHTTLFVLPRRLGDFDILREIGRGGMGVVYEAVQRSLARRVALKVLPKHTFSGNSRLERFQREAQTAARLRHTSIVPVFGVGEQDGFHYYVMPLVRGVGLDEIVAELRPGASPSERTSDDPVATHPPRLAAVVRALIAGKFPASNPEGSGAPSQAWLRRRERGVDRWTTTARLGLQAAEALQYAHAHGTLHRDVKPGNLLVDDEGNASLADFGLARAVEPSSHGCEVAKEVVGTPRYMAPEQLRGFADPRSDIYGLGLTLYELLALRPALGIRSEERGRKSDDVCPQLIPPRHFDRAIPRDLEAIVLKCLAEEPARRYPTAAALGEDLGRFLDDRPVRARPVSRLERGCRWCRRNPALAAVSSLAAVLLVAFAVAAFAGHVRTRAAYAQTRQALGRAEATSDVALEVLEDLYLQLSPERVWIPSDSDLAGQACACVGLRSARPPAPDQRNYIQVPPSEQTAVLLENLLAFYDRLAEQVGDDPRVMLQSAIASRRIGDIRQRLGQIDQAEREYRKAIEKLDALRPTAAAGAKVDTELARIHNEIGNVRAAGFEPKTAYAAHRNALRTLTAAPPAQRETEECRYELARTCYFLASRYPRPAGTPRDRRTASSAQPPALAEKEYRTRAIGLLEELVRENPDAADYRFLLALCYRPMGVVVGAPAGRRRALHILEALKRRYPQVADYRYELAATYAWVHVGLFPWQGPSIALPETEQALHNALAEARWLVENNPTIPHFARSRALILAKLGAVCSEAGRSAEAADWFERATLAQAALVERFPDLPAHDRVLLEFFRFRLAVLTAASAGPADGRGAPDARGLLGTCVENLTELCTRHDLADDRLATESLQLAKEALDGNRTVREPGFAAP